MEARLCEFCQKKLPKRLRFDARFCPGSRCRVAALRRSRQLRAASLLGPTRKDERAFIDTLQRTRERIGAFPLTRHPACQVQAELRACEILVDYYRHKETVLRRLLGRVGRALDAQEIIVRQGGSLEIPPNVTRIGMVSFPNDCEVMAVVVTSKERETRRK